MGYYPLKRVVCKGIIKFCPDISVWKCDFNGAHHCKLLHPTQYYYQRAGERLLRQQLDALVAPLPSRKLIIRPDTKKFPR